MKTERREDGMASSFAYLLETTRRSLHWQEAEFASLPSCSG